MFFLVNLIIIIYFFICFCLLKDDILIGSREFGEGEEFIEDPQATNTLSREQRDYEKRQKPRKHKQKKPAR